MDVDYNDVVATKDNGLTVTFGTDISSRIRDTYDDKCGDNNSDECKQAMREVLGLTPSADGLQRRVIGVVAVLGAVALAHVVLEAILLFDEARQPGKIQVIIPQDQKDEISAWDTSSGEFSFGECGWTTLSCEEHQLTYYPWTDPPNGDPFSVDVNIDSLSYQPAEYVRLLTKRERDVATPD